MLKTLLPTPSQQKAITDIVTGDIERRPFGHPLSVPDDFQSWVELVVHKALRHPVDGLIAHALPDSPTVPSLDGRVTLMAGAMAVGSSLATSFSMAISKHDHLTLLVPHAYAIPEEVASLQEDFGGNVVTFADNVYVRFTSDHADPEMIRRALASVIGGYSVAWLFNDCGAIVNPVLAVVAIFDGDGFAMVACSTASIRRFPSDVPLPTQARRDAPS